MPKPIDDGAPPPVEADVETPATELDVAAAMEGALSSLETIDQGAGAEPEALVAEGEAPEHGVEAEVWEKIPPKAQAKINARMQKLAAETKAAKAEAAEAKAASSEVHAAAAAVTGIPPVYFSKEEAGLVARYDTLKAHKRFCATHARNGYEGTDGTWTPEQIQAREREIDEEMLEVAPQAVAIRKAKQAQYQKDWERGRQLGQLKPGAAPKPGLPSPAAGGGAKPPVGGKPATKAGFSAKKFEEEGGTKAAFENQYANMLG